MNPRSSDFVIEVVTAPSGGQVPDWAVRGLSDKRRQRAVGPSRRRVANLGGYSGSQGTVHWTGRGVKAGPAVAIPTITPLLLIARTPAN
ncbi:hypothetical protein EV193_103565 [Herbihabitans rhizosphaerae]|uniref:Uncharacterized protein n=1 Tax=Herbihabitans rhizosphaerae TaxID=1872711 RepID=A0A4Q7KWT4_9PSEU|nr:hypothetical protein EV193_103565 [Herbihabitans rhizosphaerae]